MLMTFYFQIEVLQVRENEISLLKWPGGTAYLRNLEGTLPLVLGKAELS